MATDDRRTHEGETPGLNPGRGHEHYEDPASAADTIGTDADAPPGGPVGDIDTVGDGQDQDSALGGDVATRTGAGPTPEAERSS